MQEVWEHAKGGRHELVVVAGEPGIGKTRLSLEFARSGAADGSSVLMGYSDEENLVPYQPFVECLSWYCRHCPEVELRGQLAAIGGGGELAPFVPELRNRIPELPSPLPMDPEGQRYRLFEAVAGMLAVASRARPMLLLFEDLHWADRPTLLLLRHVTRAASMASFAIVATYRESELDRTHPLAEMLITLRRERAITRVALRGLKITCVKALVTSIVGPNAPSQLSKGVMDSTDGNPFFATEIVQHLEHAWAIGRARAVTERTIEIGDLGLSASINEVIGQRLRPLS